MAKLQSNIYKIKKDFLEGQRITPDEMKEKYGLSRATFFRYKKELEKEGFVLLTDKKTNKLYYKDSGNQIYEEISPKTIREYAILSRLSNYPNGTTKMELLKSFKDENDFEIADDTVNKSISIKKSTFYELFDELTQRGLISQNSELVYTSGLKKNMMVCKSNLPNKNLTIEDDDKLDELIDYIPLDKKTKNAALLSLKSKILILKGQNDDSVLSDENRFCQYGREHIQINRRDDYKNELNRIRPDLYKIRFEYNGKKIHFSTGIIVYSQDKDILYLIGSHGIYDYSKIKNIEILNEKNEEYLADKYIKSFHSMFSITNIESYSGKDLVHVEIEFKNTKRNQNRLNQLVMNRKSASISQNKSFICYTDDITGINDFLPYLRSFGDEYRIISCSSKSKFLKPMKNSVSQSLKDYKGQ